MTADILGLWPTWEEVTGIGTLALAAATIWLGWGTQRLAREAESHSRIELRAYLQVELGSVHISGAALNVDVNARLVNVGKTPAYEVGRLVLIRFVGLPLAEAEVTDIDDLVTGLKPDHTDLVIGPDQAVFLRSAAMIDFSLESENYELMNKGLGAIVISGFVSYKDAFGTARRTFFSHLHRKQGTQWTSDFIASGNSSDLAGLPDKHPRQRKLGGLRQRIDSLKARLKR